MSVESLQGIGNEAELGRVAVHVSRVAVAVHMAELSQSGKRPQHHEACVSSQSRLLTWSFVAVFIKA